MEPESKSGSPGAPLVLASWSSGVAPSWLSLLASTALGSEQVSQHRARIVADLTEWAEQMELSLIVQSYLPEALDPLGRPRAGSRPLGSTQRRASVGELRQGLWVDLVQLEDTPEATLVAWLDLGDSDWDYDARAARPARDAWFGEAAHALEPREIELRQRCN